MKKRLFPVAAIALCMAFASCGGKGGSAQSIAEKWCDLNGKYHKAAEGAEKDAAKEALNKYENEIEAKHKGDEAFMKEVEKAVEKCEDASEGR